MANSFFGHLPTSSPVHTKLVGEGRPGKEDSVSES
jgi:hypothetical protein